VYKRLPEASLTVRVFRTQPEFQAYVASLEIMPLGFFLTGRVAVSADISQKPQAIGFYGAVLMSTGKLENALGMLERSLIAAVEQIGAT